MVRINLVDPKALSDQHLIAEYDEILMLLGYVRRYPSLGNIPMNYALGKGHIRFFKDKLLYLKRRHDRIREEMSRRRFACRVKVDLAGFDESHLNDWKPEDEDYRIIKERIVQKIMMKPGFYRYYGKAAPAEDLIEMIRREHA